MHFIQYRLGYGIKKKKILWETVFYIIQFVPVIRETKVI